MEFLTLDVAQKLVNLAVEKGTKDFGRPICVSVCDANGDLIAFGRGIGSPLRSIRISQQKAYTAVRMGVANRRVSGEDSARQY